MDVDTPTFRNIVENILNRWTGLKMAVDHRMGGRESLEKALYLIDYLQEIFRENTNIEKEDLEDTIADYMDNEFHTEFEDGSIRDIADTLIRLHSVPVIQAVTELNSLPVSAPWLVPRPVSVRRDQHSESSSEDDEEEDEKMEEEEEEWTTVSYKKKS